jgi:hypothetical protein
LAASVTALLQTWLEQGIAPHAFYRHESNVVLAGILNAWWDSYRTLRPAWATALQALAQLLP